MNKIPVSAEAQTYALPHYEFELNWKCSRWKRASFFLHDELTSFTVILEKFCQAFVS